MTRIGLLTLLVVGADAASLAFSESPPNASNAIRLGMTQRDLKQALGPPSHVSRLILFRRHLEQWQYVDPPKWVEFNAVRGEEPVLSRFSGDGK
jgi:hypothetical protein